MFTFTLSPTHRKIIQVLSYFVLPVSLAVWSATGAIDSFFVELGGKALLLVALNLFIKPLSVLFRHSLTAQVLTLRREIGVASFWLYVFHSTGMVLGRGLSLSTIYNPAGFIIWGAVAGIGMWVLGLTSNNVAQRLLKRNWKKVQMVAYAVLPVASFHASKAEGEYGKFVLFTGTFVVLKFLQWYVSKQRRTS